MHFVPIVLAASNAWAAGIKGRGDHEETKQEVKNLHNEYDELSKLLRRHYPIVYGKLTMVEALLHEINAEMENPKLTAAGGSDIGQQAKVILDMLEDLNNEENSWTERLKNY